MLVRFSGLCIFSMSANGMEGLYCCPFVIIEASFLLYSFVSVYFYCQIETFGGFLELFLCLTTLLSVFILINKLIMTVQ